MSTHFTGTLRRVLGTLALPVVLVSACGDDDPVAVDVPDLMLEVSTTAFAETDPFVGTDEMIVLEARNAGGGQVTVTNVAIEGADASAFDVDGAGTVTLGPGESESFEIAFIPQTEGAKSAVLAVLSDAPAEGRTEIAITGLATRFQYTQVDRKGIPALNTVFNHPSGTAGFDKTAYNVVTPENDVATYTGQFETVLGAVGNADPAATAALLLPDELPVSLGASPTTFAQLTGRALTDDATDVALSVTVGFESLQSDNVDANDKAFRTEFPYVATPHD